MSLIQKFAEIHNKYQAYSKATFEVAEEGNIVYRLQNHEEFKYLFNFYNDFHNILLNKFSDNLKVRQARSQDLPFLGPNVIKTGRVKFMFVFEGSLSPVNALSITVLSHLWLTESQIIIDDYCGKGKWWTINNYLNIKRNLKLTKEIAENSFVIDALRLNDKKKCTELIYDEINLLKPKLVICVGSIARNIVGMRYVKSDTKFHSVKFPKYHKEKQIYDNLEMIINDIE